MTERLSGNDVRYLMGLVRMDIRKKERGLARLAPRAGQGGDEVDAVRHNMELGLAFRRDLLGRLAEAQEGA